MKSQAEIEKFLNQLQNHMQQLPIKNFQNNCQVAIEILEWVLRDDTPDVGPAYTLTHDDMRRTRIE